MDGSAAPQGGNAVPQTRDQLVWTADAYIRSETYQAALVRIIDAHHRLPVAALWGAGTTSSSDGQFCRLWSCRTRIRVVKCSSRSRSKTCPNQRGKFPSSPRPGPLTGETVLPS